MTIISETWYCVIKGNWMKLLHLPDIISLQNKQNICMFLRLPCLWTSELCGSFINYHVTVPPPPPLLVSYHVVMCDVTLLSSDVNMSPVCDTWWRINQFYWLVHNYVLINDMGNTYTKLINSLNYIFFCNIICKIYYYLFESLFLN